MFQLYSFRSLFEDTYGELPSIGIEHLALALIMANRMQPLARWRWGPSALIQLHANIVFSNSLFYSANVGIKERSDISELLKTEIWGSSVLDMQFNIGPVGYRIPRIATLEMHTWPYADILQSESVNI